MYENKKKDQGHWMYKVKKIFEVLSTEKENSTDWEIQENLDFKKKYRERESEYKA